MQSERVVGSPSPNTRPSKSLMENVDIACQTTERLGWAFVYTNLHEHIPWWPHCNHVVKLASEADISLPWRSK